jgi:hypothetical protein
MFLMFHQHVNFIHLQEVINSIQVYIKNKVAFISILINDICSVLLKTWLNPAAEFAYSIQLYHSGL